MKYFNLNLPVFKQGDDLAEQLDLNNNDPIKSLLGLANQYIGAARICITVASVLGKTIPKQKIEIFADTHYISVRTNETLVNDLVDQNILVEENFNE